MDPLDRLIEGYADYYAKYFQGDSELHQQLAKGQNPEVLVIACCDSRVDPALITRAKEGDLFIVRNVANVVPPYEPDGHLHGVSAAIEFAVCHLKVRHIVVKGHSGCGGIQALISGIEGEDQFISTWVSVLSEAKQRAVASKNTPEEICTFCEFEGIKVSLKNLETFPFIKTRLEEGLLHLHGWYFNLADGALLKLNPKTGDFGGVFA